MARITRRELVVAAAGSVLGGLVAEARSRREDFDIEQVEVNLPHLDPAHDGIRVAQLSDIHVGPFTPDGRIISAVRSLNALKPDLVVLTGDFVTTKRDPIDRMSDLLRDIALPTVAVLGNHDHWSSADRVTRALEKASISVLRNQHTTLALRGAPFHVLGVDDGTTRHDDAAATFGPVPRTGSRLVLTHTPSTADRLPADEGFLCLSGHTHGGGVVVPGLTRLALNMIGEPYDRGLFSVRGNQLYVNRGLGLNGPVPRVGAPPELTVLTLRRANLHAV
ncbi:MAG TPA: metallophosphoesterase [Myxococcaceae bacterium]|nr:metallophosphoesterase [Myxococcaceae bacterium]